MMTRKKIILIAILLVGLLLLFILLKAPLGGVNGPSGSYLYINGGVVSSNHTGISIGPKNIAAASPLHTKKVASMFVMPFKTYVAQQSTNTLSVQDILEITKSTDSEYVVGDSAFFLGNRWLVVTMGSPQPDGGAYSVVMYWQPKTGTWQKAGTYDGGDSLNFTAPSAIKNYLGVSQ